MLMTTVGEKKHEDRALRSRRGEGDEGSMQNIRGTSYIGDRLPQIFRVIELTCRYTPARDSLTSTKYLFASFNASRPVPAPAFLFRQGNNRWKSDAHDLEANCVTLSVHRKIGRVKRACLSGIFNWKRRKRPGERRGQKRGQKKREEEATEPSKIGHSRPTRIRPTWSRFDGSLTRTSGINDPQNLVSRHCNVTNRKSLILSRLRDHCSRCDRSYRVRNISDTFSDA